MLKGKNMENVYGKTKINKRKYETNFLTQGYGIILKSPMTNPQEKEVDLIPIKNKDLILIIKKIARLTLRGR